VSRAVRLTFALQSKLIADFKARARAAEAEGRDADAVERLVLETGERLDRDSIWDALQTLPFDAIVAQICADLGLKPTPSGDSNGTRPPPPAGGSRGAYTSGLDAERPQGAFQHPDDGDRLDRERSP
jgi:hypothetical protein